jgi:large conductance mechanosensitive channel
LPTLLQDFKSFVLRGNLLELAVAFVLGIAFAALITSLVDDVIMQLVAAIAGRPDFSELTFSIGSGVIRYGAFLTALVTFLIIGAVLFLIVRAVQRLVPPKAATRDCPSCMPSIPLGASVCAFCTREVAPVAAP